MNQNINIRKSRVDDSSTLARLFREHALYEGHDLQITNQFEQLEKGSYPAVIFVVEINNSVLGYMSLLKQYSTWDMQSYLYLDCLFLRHELRGFGVGRKLMNTASDYAKELGLSEIQWQTPVENIDAIGFYKKLGAQNKNKKRFVWDI